MARTTKPLLESIRGPGDVKRLNISELRQLCAEMRQDLTEVVTALPCGGHFGSNLGTVELTVALHYLFDTPTDKIVFDVGHQSYPHKMLTGRLAELPTIRQTNGLAPFCKPAESEHDAFGAGHGGTSISAAVGFALARDQQGQNHHVVAVIGDGSLTAGQAFEGLNHGGDAGTRLIVVVNDNGMSISPNVGALSRYMTELRVGKPYTTVKRYFEDAVRRLPLGEDALSALERIDVSMRQAILPHSYFEDLGYEYLGPIDGHEVDLLIRTLRYAKTRQGPVVIHVLTDKGKGYEPAECDPGRLHAVRPKSSGPKTLAYTDIFVEGFRRLAREDKRVMAVSAAMLDGTGLANVVDEFPGRVLDVGMAEQHAVCTAAALAVGGQRPIAAIYSTFLQRAYDQVLHDAALHKAPLILALDRGGLVGNDGPTHHGLYDYAYLRHIPHMSIMAPANEVEMLHMMRTALSYVDGPVHGPVAIRYPRTAVEGLDLPAELVDLPWGKGEIVREGQRVAVLVAGTLLSGVVEAAEILAREGHEVTVANAKFIKPLDEELVRDLAARHDVLITVEEHAVVGGFGSAVAEVLAQVASDCRLEVAGIRDEFVDHGERADQLAWHGLHVDGLVARLRAAWAGEDDISAKSVA